MLLCGTCQNSAGPLEWATLIGALTAGVGIIWAARTYLRDTKHRRAAWLGELFEMFYVKNDHKRVRRLMDSGTLAATARSGNSEAQVALEEEVVDYLNFFEFIGSLHAMGQLTREEIDMMFDYYLRLMKKPENHTYLQEEHLKYGFERVSALLSTIPDQPAT